MTYEEAIDELKSCLNGAIYVDTDYVDGITLEATRLAIEALPKQVPMKAKVSHFEHDPGWGCGKIQCFEYHCPKCKKLIDFEIDYCDGCGQRIDWSDEI